VGLSVLLAGGAVVGVLAVLMLKRVSLPPTEVVTSLPWSSLRQVL
jgi:hypothetical protein